MQVNILEAKNKLSHLVKRAQAGEEVVIANRGVPVVRLCRRKWDQPSRRAKAMGGASRLGSSAIRCLLTQGGPQKRSTLISKKRGTPESDQ